MDDTWYEDSMQSREDALVQRFGPFSPAGQVIKPQDEGWDLTIPGFAFLRFPPTETRPFWLYVTHGLTQPIEAEDFEAGKSGGQSGFGVEFALATSTEEAWPFTMLEALSSYTLSEGNPVLPSHRIPSSDLMENAPGGHLLALESPGYDTSFTTVSGEFHIVHLVGVTGAEVAEAKQLEGAEGSKALECALHQLGVGCITDRKRECLTLHPKFESTWQVCKGELPGKLVAERKKPFWKIW